MFTNQNIICIKAKIIRWFNFFSNLFRARKNQPNKVSISLLRNNLVYKKDTFLLCEVSHQPILPSSRRPLVERCTVGRQLIQT